MVALVYGITLLDLPAGCDLHFIMEEGNTGEIILSAGWSSLMYPERIARSLSASSTTVISKRVSEVHNGYYKLQFLIAATRRALSRWS